MKKKLLLIDARFYDIVRQGLGEKYDIIPSISCDQLAAPVQYHPDMVLFYTQDKTFICEPSVYHYYVKTLSPYGIKLVQGKTRLMGNYPQDIAYNIAKVGNYALGKFASCDPFIKNYLIQANCTLIDVGQGYAKCSTCIVNPNSIITSDASIYQKAVMHHIDALMIEPGNITLKGYDYGFIGGAGGLIDENTFLFFGDITKHKNFPKIQHFFNKKNVKLQWINQFPLTDVGTIMSIDIK